MAFMQPVAEHFAAYHVDTEVGGEIVPEDVCGAIDLAGDVDAGAWDNLLTYLEGSRIEGVQRKEGWYGRLSAPGYLDCTSWDGPHETAAAALASVKEFYEVDDEGDNLDGYDDDPSDDEE